MAGLAYDRRRAGGAQAANVNGATGEWIPVPVPDPRLPWEQESEPVRALPANSGHMPGNLGLPSAAEMRRQQMAADIERERFLRAQRTRELLAAEAARQPQLTPQMVQEWGAHQDHGRVDKWLADQEEKRYWPRGQKPDAIAYPTPDVPTYSVKPPEFRPSVYEAVLPHEVESTNAITRILKEGAKGFRRGADYTIPLGFSPETKQGISKLNRALPNALENEAAAWVLYKLVEAGDAALRTPGALLGGVEGLLDQTGVEMGTGTGLGRDFLGMLDSAPGHAVSALNAERQLLNSLRLARPVASYAADAAILRAEKAAGEAKKYGIRALEYPTARKYYVGENGSINLAQSDKGIAIATKGRRPVAPYRFPNGHQGHGNNHISADKVKATHDLDYDSVGQMVDRVTNNPDKIMEQANGKMLLVQNGDVNRNVVAQFRTDGDMWWRRMLGLDDPYYSVVTAFPDGKEKTRRGKTEWNRMLKQGGEVFKE